MKKIFTFLSVCLLSLPFGAKAQNDSVDVLHYDINLDIDHLTSNIFQGSTCLSVRLLQNISSFSLDLKNAAVDSIFVNGAPCPGASYQTPLVSIPTLGLAAGDTLLVCIHYHGGGYVEGYGWGGFHMDNSIHYNLGVAFSEYPHNFGRSWFPCRDNFYDKASYRFNITAKPGWKAVCSGLLHSQTLNADSSTTFDWRLSHPTPTYLVSVALGPFKTISRNYVGLYDTYPGLIAYLNYDSARVSTAYDILDDVVPMFERCFGPYRWDRIGYVGTPKGSMEHATNIALVNSCMSNTSIPCQSVICHELSHAWFGNLLTCASSLDMWFNEGGASFCEEVAMEGAFGRQFADQYAEENLESVIRTAHISDDGYKPVYGQTPDYTYGSTVYNKGATVWHTIRGHLGDSLFYSSMQRLFDHMAFSTISSSQLCDSLSLYSNTDLHDLFNFHVFQPGFLDYRIDSLSSSNGATTIFLRQQIIAANSPCASNRVPVTFFGPDLQTAHRIVSFNGTSGQQSFSLPFSPVFAVVDLNRSISNAAIGDTLSLRKKGTVELPLSHFKTNVKKVDSTTASLLYVSHHWTAPDPANNTGFVRMANRYWTVSGIIPSGTSLNGMFRYTKSKANATYANLDYGFYDNSSSIDSIQLLYRKDCSHPWTIVRSQRNGTNNEGFFTISSLKLGEYTLAVVDSSLLSIESPSLDNSFSASVCPNPSSGLVSVSIDTPGFYSLSIRDLQGRKVYSKNKVSAPNTLLISLPKGIFLVNISQKNNTLYSQKILIN